MLLTSFCYHFWCPECVFDICPLSHRNVSVRTICIVFRIVFCDVTSCDPSVVPGVAGLVSPSLVSQHWSGKDKSSYAWREGSTHKCLTRVVTILAHSQKCRTFHVILRSLFLFWHFKACYYRWWLLSLCFSAQYYCNSLIFINVYWTQAYIIARRRRVWAG